MDLPGGTLTFLFTDIEGSTILWAKYPEPMQRALARHREVIIACVEQHGGTFVRTRGEGDSTFSVFPVAADALAACCAFQRAFAVEPWPAETPIRVRAALHTGTAVLGDGDYNSTDVNRCARLRSITHGGQTLVSQTVYDLTLEHLTDNISLMDMGLHRLKDLSRPEHVWQLCHPDLPAHFPPLASLNPTATNLPIQPTSFIDRQKELAEIEALLAASRLLTLTGPGGSGKTRLSQHAAADLLDSYLDGAWLVELAPLSDPALVTQTVAGVLNVKEETDKPLLQTLTADLKSQSLLLILDNCEHLLDACAQLADALLRSCPGVKLLATSREGLGIAGETTYRVPSLSVPALGQTHTVERLSQYAAVRLFIERAAAVDPAFHVTNENAPAVASICYRLDGIPLAIELAAARVRSLSVEEINSRLDDRFRLLTGGSRTALPRQQTLRALIDWSFDLLTEPERTLLRRLSVFAGGWTLAAAEFVCGADEGIGGRGSGAVSEAQQGAGSSPDLTPDAQISAFHRHPTSGTRHPFEVLDLLTSLVDKSLVIAEQHEGSTRYRLLETMRQYAWEKWQESREERVRGRHLDYYLALAEEAEPKLDGPEQKEWFERLDSELDNFRAALAYSTTEGEKGRRGEGEQKQGIGNREQGTEDRAEEREEQSKIQNPKSKIALRLAAALGYFWSVRGYWREGREQLQAALALGGTARTVERARALRAAGGLAYAQDDYAAARVLLEESLGIDQELGNKQGIAVSLNIMTRVTMEQGDYGQSRSYCEQALQIDRELGHRAGEAANLRNLARLAGYEGDHKQARSYYEQALAINREIGNQSRESDCLQGLAYSAQQQGEYTQARSYFEQSLAIDTELGRRDCKAYDLNGLGSVASALGEDEQAQSYYEQALLIYQEIGDRSGEAATFAGLGILAERLSDFTQASNLFKQALQLRYRLGQKEETAESLEHFASLAVLLTRFERAARLYGTAAALRESIGAPMSPDERALYERRAAAVCTGLGGAVFSSAWTEGQAMTLLRAIEYALLDES